MPTITEEAMSYSFQELSVHYGVFHSENISRIPRKKQIVTKECVMTDIGETEVAEWKRLIKETIREAGEEELFQNLYDWVLEGCAWLHTDSEREYHALELHAKRNFDNREWAGFVGFNRRYRPGFIDEGSLVTIKTVCCKKVGQVTQEHINRSGDRICCPYCGRFSEYERVSTLL